METYSRLRSFWSLPIPISFRPFLLLSNPAVPVHFFIYPVSNTVYISKITETPSCNFIWATGKMIKLEIITKRKPIELYEKPSIWNQIIHALGTNLPTD